MSKDFVEIRPVTLKGDAFVTVFGDEDRAPSKVSGVRAGTFDLVENPQHVPGAYANLRHYRSRRSLEAAGLSAEVGTTHHLTLEDAVRLFALQALTASADGAIDFGSVDHLAASVRQAVVAARTGGASHIEIAIS